MRNITCENVSLINASGRSKWVEISFFSWQQMRETCWRTQTSENQTIYSVPKCRQKNQLVGGLLLSPRCSCTRHILSASDKNGEGFPQFFVSNPYSFDVISDGISRNVDHLEYAYFSVRVQKSDASQGLRSRSIHPIPRRGKNDISRSNNFSWIFSWIRI